MLSDGQAGDVNYATCVNAFSQYRAADPHIERAIHAALGDARTVLNVGAGTGSYEPRDRTVVAVEPSAAMRQRRPRDLVPAIRGRAEELPFDDNTFAASMAVSTVHQWQDLNAGLAELVRVTAGPIVVFTFDGAAFPKFWLAEYVPTLIASEQRRLPAIDSLVAKLTTAGRTVSVAQIPIPHDCTDGFTEAYYPRPEMFLDPAALQAQSSWLLVSETIRDQFVTQLRNDLESGEWDRRFGNWRKLESYEGSLRLIVSVPSATYST